jgi:hypothetical protein
VQAGGRGFDSHRLHQASQGADLRASAKPFIKGSSEG